MFLQGALISFSGNGIFETKIWIPGVLIAADISLNVSGPSNFLAFPGPALLHGGS